MTLHAEHILAAVVTLGVAAVAAFGYLITLTMQLDRDQTTRLNLWRLEIADNLATAERRLTQRLERIENAGRMHRTGSMSKPGD